MDSEWNSPNPEYWHVYEVDDWEMQLEDIDTLNFRHPLGKGNFGMVYRGLVKTLRTPAHCFYTDPNSIAAAIKVLKDVDLFYSSHHSEKPIGSALRNLARLAPYIIALTVYFLNILLL